MNNSGFKVDVFLLRVGLLSRESDQRQRHASSHKYVTINSAKINQNVLEPSALFIKKLLSPASRQTFSDNSFTYGLIRVH